MNYEVEQKHRVEEPAGLEARLRQLGVTFGPAKLQVDAYYGHPARDFARTDEALRLRTIGDDCYITYKGPKLDRTTKTRREIELPLGQVQETGGRWPELLTALGFRLVREVRKLRRHGTLSWEGADLELAWDEVDGVGTFVEIEQVTDAAGLDAARTRVSSLAVVLGLRQHERRSYLELALGVSNPPPT